MVVSAASTPVITVSVPFVCPPVALLPLSSPTCIVVGVEEPILCGMETRGPPTASIVLTTPSLRAPPIA